MKVFTYGIGEKTNMVVLIYAVLLANSPILWFWFWFWEWTPSIGRSARNLAELEFSLTRVLMTTTPPSWPTCTSRWCRIDPGLATAATRVPAASWEDARPQAILQFQPHNNLDYRVHYEPKLTPQYLKKAFLRRSRVSTGNLWLGLLQHFQRLPHLYLKKFLRSCNELSLIWDKL